jgi:hypothetical protein
LVIFLLECFKFVELSEGDILRLNRLYQCPGYESNLLTIADSNRTHEKVSNNITTLDDDKDDMILTKEQKDILYTTNSAKRNGLKSAFHHWPNGVVPFEIDPSFSKYLMQKKIFYFNDIYN